VSQDFLEGCISDIGKDKGSYQDFQETFCQRCRNAECVHAQWVKDKFSDRVQTQPDRMFHPHQADPKSPKYAHLVEFTSMMREAIQLEIADRKGDWEVPEVPILDGRQETTKLRTTSSVDEAIQRLAQSKGQSIDLPDPIKEASKEFVQETQTIMSQVQPEIPVVPDPVPSVPVIESPKPQTQIVMPTEKNTSVPKGGIMIGGDKVSSSPAPKADPWVPPPSKGNVVPVGAKITLKGEPE
jgi:hypothetical protein